MSEPDSTPRRRPPTIDLTAQEVESERDASTSTAAGAETPAGRRGRRLPILPHVVGILVGAAVVAAIGAGLWFAGLMPVRDRMAASAPVTSPIAAANIASRLGKIEEALQAPRADDALVARLTAAEAQLKSLGDSLAALTRRVDEIAGAAKSASTAAEDAKRAAQAMPAQDIPALVDRVAALENAVKTMRADAAAHAANADDSAARAVVAAEALRAAVERGAPYQAELAAAKSLGAAQGSAAALEPFAAGGVPSAASLGRELSALVPALARAAEPQSDGGGSFLGRLESRARNLVRIRPLNGAAPSSEADDAATVISRIDADAARGDIAAALADIARLPADARAVAASWVEKAQARQAALSASDRIAADALSTIAKPATQ